MATKLTGLDRAPRKKTAYHHGDLREALILAAHRLIAERGPEDFTLADACRLAGVSTAAPYRHFADRGALVEAVALRGFDLLSQKTRGARDRHPVGSIEAIVAMGQAYVHFAEAEPALFRLMFGRHRACSTGPAPTPEGGACFNVLLEGVEGFLTKHGRQSCGVMTLALPLWTIVHGTSSLSIDRDFEGVAPGTDVDRLVDDATRGFLTGFLVEAARRDEGT